MKDNVVIRPETEKDYRAVEELTREAFWNVYKPGADEHYFSCMRCVPIPISFRSLPSCWSWTAGSSATSCTPGPGWRTRTAGERLSLIHI